MIDPRLLQLCDSAFPSGAFSHSFGLETAILERGLRDPDRIGRWIETYLRRSVATMDARAIALSLGRFATPDELDRALSAALFAPDLRAATRRLARATLDAYDAMGIASPAIAAYRAGLDTGAAHGHHAIACALGSRSIGASTDDACCAYLSSAASALAAAAARAVPLGQRDVGRILWSMRDAIRDAAHAASAARSVSDLSASAIECEIDALRHSLLDGRLFAS